jgi:hypothetical protein
VGTNLDELLKPIDHLDEEEFPDEIQENEQVIDIESPTIDEDTLEQLLGIAEPDLMDRLEKFFPGFNDRVAKERGYDPGSQVAIEVEDQDSQLILETDTGEADFGVGDYCRQSEKLEIQRIQSDETFNGGIWFFAGLTQSRCHECNSKPQLLFMTHVATKEGSASHKWGLGCQDCAVVSHGSKYSKDALANISKELEIEKNLKHLCVKCGDTT